MVDENIRLFQILTAQILKAIEEEREDRKEACQSLKEELKTIVGTHIKDCEKLQSQLTKIKEETLQEMKADILKNEWRNRLLIAALSAGGTLGGLKLSQFLFQTHER
jgi:hypothetical protein